VATQGQTAYLTGVSTGNACLGQDSHWVEGEVFASRELTLTKPGVREKRTRLTKNTAKEKQQKPVGTVVVQLLRPVQSYKDRVVRRRRTPLHEAVSRRLLCTPRQTCLFIHELQWQSRGK
jgi:hypothetical protein